MPLHDNGPLPFCTQDSATRRVTLAWPDGRQAIHSFAWLRHAAQCPGGMPNDTVNKLELLPDDPASLAIRDLWVTDGELCIAWCDGNFVTHHPLADLKDTTALHSSPRLWRAEDSERLPRFDFEMLDSDEHLLELFLAVRDWGLALIRQVPLADEEVSRLASRFGEGFSMRA